MGVPQFNANTLDPRKHHITTLCANRDNRNYRNNAFAGNEAMISEFIYDNEDRRKFSGLNYNKQVYNELIPPVLIVGTMFLLLNI